MNLRPRRAEPPHVDITPLIDVVFLMLIFFMVSTTFEKETQLKVDLTDAATTETTEQPVAEVRSATVEQPTSKLPTRLKGYRWPVRGGMIARYYEAHPKGEFQIAGERMHDGIIITWFEGAIVKAAHKGKVVAAGRDLSAPVAAAPPPFTIFVASGDTIECAVGNGGSHGCAAVVLGAHVETTAAFQVELEHSSDGGFVIHRQDAFAVKMGFLLDHRSFLSNRLSDCIIT